MARFKPRSNKLNTFRSAGHKLPAGAHELAVGALADDGRGIAKVNGKTVFVLGALPGERVSAEYSAVHRNFDEARTLAVLEPSEVRTDPPCRYFGRCGGCDLQHLTYEEQLKHKQQAIEYRLVKQLGSDPVSFDPPIPSQPLHYRHRAKISVKADKEGCLFGFKQQTSHRVVDIDYCHLLSESLNRLLPDLKHLIGSLLGRSGIDHVVMVEDSTGRLAVSIRSKRPLSNEDLESLLRFVDSQGVSVSLVTTDRDGNDFTWHSDMENISLNYAVRGQEQGQGRSISLQYSVNDFTQVNPVVNDAMVDRALEWLQLTPADSVLDLFCGIGNFSLPMARVASRVTGVELSEGMVERARRNADNNQITNSEFIAADLMAAKIEIDVGYTKTYNKALLDPPRAGAAQVCEQIGRWEIRDLLYISCNPNTFFRDAEILSTNGFRLHRIAVVDMFPQTAHSELIALFKTGDA